MTLEQLHVLASIVEHGGFRAAANALYRSQSAVSIAIRNLEEELELKLFLRDQYRPTLTDEGKALYEKAKRILAQTDEFSNLARHLAAGEEPELRLAMSALVPVDQTLSILKEITELAPTTKLSLLVETLNGTMERLDDGDADIAMSETFEHHPDYEYAALTEVEMVSVISPKSKLARKTKHITQEDLQGSIQIIVRDTSQHSDKKTAGVMAGIQHWVVNDFAMKKRIIASGIGWGRMPRHMVEKEINSGELLMQTEVNFSPIQVQINIVRRKNKPMGPVATELWQRLQNINWS